MKIFIGKIPSELDGDTVYNHFKTLGEIDHYNFKGQFAFVEYKNDSDAEKVLNMKEIEINGQYVIVEESNSRGRPRNDFNEPRRDDYPPMSPPRRDDYRPMSPPRRDDYRQPRYDDNLPPRFDDDRRSRYDDFRGPEPYPSRYSQSRSYDNHRAPESYPQRSGYDSRAPAYKDDYNRQPLRSDRDNCYHCSRCEIHGNPRSGRQDTFEHKKPRREHPNDVNKIVIQNIPQDAEITDIDDFVRRNELESVFSRLTIKRDAAIVEFRDISTRDQAISKLDGQELKGVTVHVREFRVSSNFQGSQSNFSENSRYNSNKDSNYGNNQNDDNQGVDIYSGIDK